MTYAFVRCEVDMSDLDVDDLVSKLESRGYECVKRSKGAAYTPLPDGLERVDHLLTCGMRDVARAEALELCGRAIGRPL